MLNNKKQKFCLFTFLVLTIIFPHIETFAQKEPNLGLIYKDAKNRKGKNPIIIVPGILGSELINKKTKEKVWYSVGRSDDDDLRLPIALDTKLSKDNLVPGDIIREVELTLLPDQKIYIQLINTLKGFGGYEEATWDNPPDDLKDKFFVFPYDWRRDNVETAHLLLQKLDKLRKDSKKTDEKFNVLAHSMGGLITRYAMMYGKADLPKGNPVPNWSGENYFNKVFLFGTPNEGSAGALKTLLNGSSSLGGSSNLPFVRNLSPVDIATMPSVFQLLPHSRTARFFDEDLRPLNIDLYDVRTWRKYSWAIFKDPDYLKGFSEAEFGRFEQYFSIVLRRAEKFHQALDAASSKRISVGLFIIGSDCKRTLDGIVLYQDEKHNKWVTLTEPDSFRNSKGIKIRGEQLKELMLKPGDGEVTRRSLLAESLAGNRRKSNLFDSALPLTYAMFICEDHKDITSNITIQNNVLTALISEANQ
jgi:hypothetical protein